jgi:hypothetical protein
MDSIRNLIPEIQKRISKIEHFLAKEGMKRPEVKFTLAILTSMLLFRQLNRQQSFFDSSALYAPFRR